MEVHVTDEANGEYGYITDGTNAVRRVGYRWSV